MADTPVAPEAPAAPVLQPQSVLLESALLLALRLAYFLLARRFLHQLNPALRDLQKPDTLPSHAPPSHTAHSSHARRDRASSRASLASVRSVQSTHSASSARPASVRAPTPSTSSAALPTQSEDESSSAPSSPGPSIRILHEDGHGPGEASGSAAGAGGIEMGLLGAKLQPPRSRQVLELAHARERPRGGKRAARGLGRVARTLFALCFAESMNLVTLVVFQAAGVLHARARQVNFNVSLHVLLAIVLVVVPMVQCLLFTYRSREPSSSTRISSLSLTSRVLISIIPFLLYIFLFTRIPPYITAIDDWDGGGWLVPSLGRVVVLGVLTMASLSGIGAVKTAWDYLEQAAGGGRKISNADVLQAERSLYRVRQDVVAKRDEINRLTAAQPERSGPGWISGVFGSKTDQRMAALQSELQGLQAMEAELSRSLTGMKTKQKRQGFRKTWSGTFINMLGYVFAIYCGARVLMCLVSIFFSPLATSTLDPNAHHGNTNGDWISFLVAYGLSHLPIQDFDIPTWSRGISLLLTGLLILSSLSMVLRWLTRVLRMTSRTVGAGFLLLTLGQLYATYVISLLVQLRTSLPPPPSELPAVPGVPGGNGTETASTEATYAAVMATYKDDSLLRSLPDFRVFGRLFDVVFLLAALGTAIYRYIAMRVARSDDGEVFGLGR